MLYVLDFLLLKKIVLYTSKVNASSLCRSYGPTSLSVFGYQHCIGFQERWGERGVTDILSVAFYSISEAQYHLIQQMMSDEQLSLVSMVAGQALF